MLLFENFSIIIKKKKLPNKYIFFLHAKYKHDKSITK